MMKNLMVLAALLGCVPAQAAAKAPSKGETLVRGEKVPLRTTVSLAELLTAPAAQEGKEVVVEGKVRQACTRKGCWMELAQDRSAAGIRVTFKDYAFFVPTDSAGSTARVQGKVHLASVSEKDAEHYRSEGATVPTGPDGKPREIQLVASGVELHR